MNKILKNIISSINMKKMKQEIKILRMASHNDRLVGSKQ